MLGESVCIEDLGLQESLTILICHCMMLRAVSGAPLWAKIFKTIFPKYKNGIKKEMLLKELEIMFDGKVNTKNIAPFYGSYDSFFSSFCFWMFVSIETLCTRLKAIIKHIVYDPP